MHFLDNLNFLFDKKFNNGLKETFPAVLYLVQQFLLHHANQKSLFFFRLAHG